MKVELALGGLLDISTPDEVAGIVDMRVSGLEDFLKSLTANGDSNIARPLSASGVSTASFATVPVLLDLGTPPQGRAWDLRHVTVVGPSPLGAALVTPVVCFVTQMPIPNPIPAIASGPPFELQAAADVATQLPAKLSYGKAEMVLTAGEHYYIAIMATANNQFFYANCRAVEVDASSIRRMKP